MHARGVPDRVFGHEKVSHSRVGGFSIPQSNPHHARAMPQSQMKGHIPSLTGFRGFAALIVLFNHVGQYSGLEAFLPVRYGYFGVPCFFCLSGALFALLYLEKATTEASFLGPYYTARFIRIFPVYWLVLALYALSVSPVNWAAMNWHVVMGHGFFADYRNAINTPMWTLPVECGFYLLAPWVFVAMRRFQDRFESASPELGSFRWIHVVSLAAFSFVLWSVGAGLHMLAPNDPEWWKGTIFGRFSQFGLGVLTGLLLADVRSGAIRLSYSTGNWLVLAAIGLLVSQAAVLEKMAHHAASGLPLWLYHGVKLSLAVTACLLILAAGCNSIWQRFLASRPMIYLGAISYALYLLQCASFGPVHNLSATAARYFDGLGFNPWATGGIAILICVGAAMLVHHAFEAPVQQWLRRNLLRGPSA